MHLLFSLTTLALVIAAFVLAILAYTKKQTITHIPSAALYNGGNSFGSTMSLGTNDDYALVLKTNDTTAMTISPKQQVTFTNPFVFSGITQTAAASADYTLTWPASVPTSKAQINILSTGAMIYNSPNVVFATDSTIVTNAATSFIATGTSATINVSAKTSKVVIGANGLYNTSAAGVTIFSNASGSFVNLVGSSNPNMFTGENGFIHWIDTPGVTGNVTYTVYLASVFGSTVQWGETNILNTISLAEIFT